MQQLLSFSIPTTSGSKLDLRSTIHGISLIVAHLKGAVDRQVSSYTLNEYNEYRVDVIDDLASGF